MFVTIYGINNIGKSTQIQRLVGRLRQNDFTVEHIKYPIYHLEPTGGQLNYFLRDPQAPRLSGESFQMLYIQNRQDFEPELKRLLATNDVVVAEDYIGTGLAWGMTQGVPLSWLEAKNKELLTVDADVEILMDGERFLSGKEEGHLNEENDAEIDETRKNLLFLAERYGWPVVNAHGTEEEVAEGVWGVVRDKLDERRPTVAKPLNLKPYVKPFSEWNELKQQLHASKNEIYFYEREIWYCSIGINIGREQDGKNDDCERPVLVYKKFNRDLFLGIPLTTQDKTGKNYLPLSSFKGSKSNLILSQIRAFDRKRLKRKIRKLTSQEFIGVHTHLAFLIHKNDPPPAN